jgi:hypothetical protein
VTCCTLGLPDSVSSRRACRPTAGRARQKAAQAISSSGSLPIRTFNRLFLHADRDLKCRFERARRNRKSLSDRQRLFSKRVHLL